MKKLLIIKLLIVCCALIYTYAVASDDHHHGHGNHDNMSHQDHNNMGNHSGMFLIEKNINDYKVSFHVMEATEGMHHGGSHNLMIKIEHGSHTMHNIKINSKVIHPNGHSETKPLMRMGDWYMNGYDLGHSGQHQLMILFKTADGKKHKAGVYYPK